MNALRSFLHDRNWMFCLALLLLLARPALAQTTTTWTGGGADGLWNTAANWDQGVPAEGTNALIGAGNVVNYGVPMSATSFSVLDLGSAVLNVDAAGFVVDGSGAAIAIQSATTGNNFPTNGLYVGNGGVVSIPNGNLVLTNNSVISVAAGGSLTINGTLQIGGVSGNNDLRVCVTNTGGVLSALATTLNPNNAAGANQANLGAALYVLGGTNDLGDVTIRRSPAASSQANDALGRQGLVISNGLVRTTSLDIGGPNGNSWLTMLVAGGTVTNSGNFTVRTTGTANRGSRFYQTGGLFVSSGVDSVRLRGQTAQNGLVAYSVTGGTNLVSGFVLADAGDTLGTVNLTNAAKIYIGSGGMTMEGTLTATNVLLNGGGVFGASENWSGNVPITLNGGAIETADLAGAPRDISLAAGLKGTAALTKTGVGRLTLDGANTHSGNTVISQGTLALGASGTIASSPQIIVGSGAAFDVSAVSGGYALPATRTLAGAGTVVGPVALASGATVNPGSNVVTGTLTFVNSLSQSGGGILHFDLPAAPGPGNDRIVVGGDLEASGVNIVEVVGGGSPGTVHTLIQYGGAFNGTLANLSLSGATGVLSNNAATKTIALVVQSAIRSPTSVVWVGNPTVNDWDVLNRTNWLNGGALDYFVTGDTVVFNAIGAANPNVNIVGNVAPASVTVDAAANYTFGGSGSISGDATSLTKTNAGTLTLAATNTYGGATILGGGVVVAALLADAGAPSAIGAADADVTKLQFHGGTLRYVGDSVAMNRPMTLNAGGATLDIATGSATLTLNGALSGPGALTKAGPGGLVLNAANAHSGGTIINNSTVQLNAATAFGSAGVTNTGAALRINGALTLDNAMEFSGSCTVDAMGAPGNTALRGAWTGSGTVNIVNVESASRTFTLGGGGAGGGHMWDFSGTVAFGTNVGFLRINNDNSTFNFGSSNAVFDIGTGTGTLNQRNGGTTTHLGGLIGGPNTTLAGRGNTGASGTTTYSIGGKDLSTTFEGAITDGSGQTAITKVGTGTLRLTGTANHTGNTVVESGVLQVDGHFTASPVSVLGGTLSGTGTLDGFVDVQSGGVLSPGASLGTLTINSTLTLAGDTLIEVNQGVGYDQVAATAINYGGTLTITNIGGALSDGDNFPLFSTATPNGNFATVAGSPGGGLAWSFDPATGVATVVAGGPKLEYTQIGNALQFTWSGSYKLQVQTNALNIGLSTNWVDYPGGGSSGVNVPIDAASPSVFFRLATP